MRLSVFAFASCAAIMTAVAAGQEYSGSTSQASTSVLRPAATVAWRNYAAVPDGPCGHPMSVQADCYDVCRPCGPLHPICFVRRVTRMLDCLLPCNLCCGSGGGGCGLFHGCRLGGRNWGHCGMCCGGGGGGVGCGRASGCCPNPCGSAFADVPCGGHSYGCTSTVPSFTDPFIDDPLPPTPTAQPVEASHAAPRKLQPPATHTRTVVPQRPVPSPPSRTAAVQPASRSPYKVISDPTPSSAARVINRNGGTTSASSRQQSSPSVLRRTSAEEPSYEPAPLNVDPSHAAPIIRSQSPDETADYSVPRNPLRR
jgi:hypothetical protein